MNKNDLSRNLLYAPLTCPIFSGKYLDPESCFYFGTQCRSIFFIAVFNTPAVAGSPGGCKVSVHKADIQGAVLK